MPGRPKQTMTTPISSVISSSWQTELFKLFKLFGWFSIHVPLNCVCHLFPNETRNLGSQFPYKKKPFTSLCTQALCVLQNWHDWGYLFSRLRKHMDESMLLLIVCSLLTRHLLQHFLFLDHGLLIANCFHKYWILTDLKVVLLGFFSSLWVLSLNSCLIIQHKVFLNEKFLF